MTFELQILLTTLVFIVVVMLAILFSLSRRAGTELVPERVTEEAPEDVLPPSIEDAQVATDDTRASDVAVPVACISGKQVGTFHGIDADDIPVATVINAESRQLREMV